MSAPDIVALGDALVIAAEAAQRARLAYDSAARMAVLSAFGVANWDGTGLKVVQGEYNERWLILHHDAKRRAWVSMASAVLGGPGARVEALADTPRSAVDQALAALRLTHPAEADALAAVVPPSPTEST